MSLVLNQITVPVSGSGAVLICSVASSGTVTLSVPSGSQQIYVGMTSTMTSSNGFPIPAGSPPVRFEVKVTATPVTLYALNSSAGTPSVIGYAVSTTA